MTRIEKKQICLTWKKRIKDQGCYINDVCKNLKIEWSLFGRYLTGKTVPNDKRFHEIEYFIKNMEKGRP